MKTSTTTTTTTISQSLSLILIFFTAVTAAVNHNGSSLPGIEFPGHMSFNAVSSSVTSSDCTHREQELVISFDSTPSSPTKNPVKLHLNRRRAEPGESSVLSSTLRDSSRIQTLHRRITEKKNKKTPDSPLQKRAVSPSTSPAAAEGQMIATLESGVGFGSGEYFMDVFVGTPPRHFSLILDTGSDLNWIQCQPCRDCFDQNGPFYDPAASSSYRNITCGDPRCGLVSPPDPPHPCRSPSDPCPYYYWYGDSSNTTGDFAVETFTVNLTAGGRAESRAVEGVMFGCGHWNRGLFRGAAGLLGLGRGPLSFSSQLQSLYGRSFSYCLVSPNSAADVTSKLVFGGGGGDEEEEVAGKREMNFTALVDGKDSPAETFYYVEVKSVVVGGETLKIPEETWRMTAEGGGGTIIDSGTTLSYFAEPGYGAMREAFERKVEGGGYRRAVVGRDFPLELCYNVSGVESMELPDFGIVFSDGAEWNFPAENYFIQFEQQEIACLAFKKASVSGLNIIGNYQQQNFHILYDTNNSRLGYVPMNCTEV